MTSERLAHIEAVLLDCSKSGALAPWSITVELFHALKDERWHRQHFEAMYMLACGATAEQVSSSSPFKDQG